MWKKLFFAPYLKSWQKRSNSISVWSSQETICHLQSTPITMHQMHQVHHTAQHIKACRCGGTKWEIGDSYVGLVTPWSHLSHQFKTWKYLNLSAWLKYPPVLWVFELKTRQCNLKFTESLARRVIHHSTFKDPFPWNILALWFWNYQLEQRYTCAKPEDMLGFPNPLAFGTQEGTLPSAGWLKVMQQHFEGLPDQSQDSRIRKGGGSLITLTFTRS